MDALLYLEHKKHVFFLSKNSKVPPKNYHWRDEHPNQLDIELHDGNFGWALGERDLVLDIDPDRGGDEAFLRLCDDLKINLDVTVYTRSGGRHFYLTIPEWFDNASFSKQLPQYKGIDFLTHGMYVVTVGSKVDNKPYRWASERKFFQEEAPEALCTFYRKLQDKGVSKSGEPKSDLASIVSGSNISPEKVLQLLDALDPDCEYNDWLDVGMALHNWQPIEGLQYWLNWSKKGKKWEKNEEGELEEKWGGFDNDGGVTLGTVYHMVKRVNVDKSESFVDQVKLAIKNADAKSLQVDIMPKIKRNTEMSPIDRDRLAKVIQSRYKELEGSMPSIAAVRKMIEETNYAEREGEAPLWCHDWIYVTRFSSFLNVYTKQLCKSEAFNVTCGINVPFTEKGTKPSATRYVSDNGFVDVVNDIMYLPTVEQDMLMIENRRVFNTFNRMSVPKAAEKYTPEGHKAIAVFERHLSFLCNGNEEHISILRQWLAHQVQHIGVKIYWSPLIQSTYGTGKSWLGNLLRSVLGLLNVGTVKSDQLKSPHNTWAANKCVNILEEIRVVGNNRHEIFNNIKPLISDSNIQINPKGVDQYEVINTTNYICFTNFKDALPLENGDRRFWVIFMDIENIAEIENLYDMSPTQYFEELYDSLEQRDQLRKYLLEVELTPEFLAIKRAPDTKYKSAMVDGESTSVDGYQEVVEAIELGIQYVQGDILSSSHLFEYVESQNSDIRLTNIDKNKVLKKLGYMKLPKREKIDGRMCQIWAKTLPDADAIRQFKKR